ncbi:MAG: sugar transferase, partial [Chthoniobacterales bacterium]
LKGEMSLVGPRPERPEFVSRLEKEIPFYRARLAIKPGLTGWAQIKSGYANSIDEAKTKLEYDLYYIKNRSLWLDVLILLQTVRVMLGHRGR